MFILDQVGLPTGTFDRSRTDGLDNGDAINITYTGTGTFRPRLLWVPYGDTSAISSLVEIAPHLWACNPTAYCYGSYLIQGIENEGRPNERRVERIFGIRNRSGILIPAYGERANALANLESATATHVAQATNNATDYTRAALNALPWSGYLRFWQEMAEVVDASVFRNPNGFIPLGLFAPTDNWASSWNGTLTVLLQTAATVNAVQAEVTHLLRQGQSLTRIVATVCGVSHAILPLEMPRVIFSSCLVSDVSLTPTMTTIFLGLDASSSLDYHLVHQITGTDARHIVDVATRRYFIHIVGEYGTYSAIGLRLSAVQLIEQS
jgi:hypothetical protein